MIMDFSYSSFAAHRPIHLFFLSFFGSFNVQQSCDEKKDEYRLEAEWQDDVYESADV